MLFFCFCRVYSKQSYFNDPWNSTQTHYECEAMEGNHIALGHITNPTDYRINNKCKISLEKHEQPIAGSESEMI